MNYLMVVEKKINCKKIILTLLCFLAIVILTAFFINRLYEYFRQKNIEALSRNIANQTKTERKIIPDKLHSDFQKSKELVKSAKNTVPLSEKQYNNIINIYSVSPSKTVYLTFDDGPSRNITPLILDLLNKEQIKATFFLLGTNVENNPDIVQREYSEGHFLANHGYSHQYSVIYENSDTLLNDFSRCEQSLRKALNNDNFVSKVFRFPGGSTGGRFHNIKQEIKIALKDKNIAYLDWNALTCDAEGTPTKESIIENLHKTVGDKEVVVLLMHDSSSKILTYETLPEVISFFRERGYSFKTLYDALLY